MAACTTDEICSHARAMRLTHREFVQTGTAARTGVAPLADTQTDQLQRAQLETQAPAAGTQFDSVAASAAMPQLAVGSGAAATPAASPRDGPPAASQPPNDAQAATAPVPAEAATEPAHPDEGAAEKVREGASPARPGRQADQRAAAGAGTPPRPGRPISGGVDPLCSRVSPTQHHAPGTRTPATSARCPCSSQRTTWACVSRESGITTTILGSSLVCSKVLCAYWTFESLQLWIVILI